MAEREALQKQYAYHEMSSKVVQADRSARRNRGEPTGEVESLRGRSDIGRMGDRVTVATEAPPPVKKKARREGPVPKKEKPSLLSGTSILEMNVTGYQPTTPAARAAYENLLVRRVIAAISHCVHLAFSYILVFMLCRQ